MATTTGKMATLVVPPVYQVALFGQGFNAVQITARKVTLLKEGAPDVSAFYSRTDAVENMSFADLVQFVLNKNKG